MKIIWQFSSYKALKNAAENDEMNHLNVQLTHKSENPKLPEMKVKPEMEEQVGQDCSGGWGGAS